MTPEMARAGRPQRRAPDRGDERPGPPAAATSTSPRSRTDARTAYAPHAYRRLAAIKAQVDPDEVLLANHSIRPAR